MWYVAVAQTPGSLAMRGHRVRFNVACRCPQVRGDFDDVTFLPGIADSLPETKVVKIGQFQLGLCHGHQVVPWGDTEALGAMQRQLDCDILVTGHTHAFTAYEAEGKLFINPGSATGAFSPSFKLTEEPTPSFVLMDVQQTRVVIYVYELVGEDVRPPPAAATAAASTCAAAILHVHPIHPSHTPIPHTHPTCPTHRCRQYQLSPYSFLMCAAG